MIEFKTGITAKYQYKGKSHTQVRLVNGQPKVTVQPDEVIKSNIDPKYFTNNHFIELGADVKEYQKAKENLETAQKVFEKAQSGSQDETMTIAEAKKYCEDNAIKYHARTGDAKIIELALAHKSGKSVEEEADVQE